MQQENFKNFGYQYQTKLIACLLNDTKFAATIYDVLKVEYFSEEPLQYIVEVIFEYFSKYNTMPTPDVFKVMVDKLGDDDDMKIRVVEDLIKINSFSDSKDLEFVKDHTIEFCRLEEVKLAMLDGVNFLRENDIDGLVKSIVDASQRGQDNDMGLDYTNQVDERYSEDARRTITTGFPVLDKLTNGGLAQGEIGLVAAPSGAGKSWMLTKIASNIVEVGKHVLYLSLELNKNYVGIRMDGLLTRMNIKDLPNNLDIVKKKMGSLYGKATVQWFPSGTLSIVKLRSYIERMIHAGEKPDVIIIDYADLMFMSGDNTMRHDQKLKRLFEMLRQLSGEYDAPIWTATQTSRDSYDDSIKYIDASTISDSIGKNQTADFTVSLRRNQDDKENRRGMLYVIKNRFGEDGMLLPVKMDLHNCIIEIFGSKKNDDKQQTIQQLAEIGMKNNQQNQRSLTDFMDYRQQSIEQHFKKLPSANLTQDSG